MNRQILFVNITGIVIGLAYGIHGPILPIFSTTVVGASYTELGIIGLANFVPYMFIPFLVGLLLDRFNHGKLLVIGVVINTAAMYLLSIAQTVPELMAYRAMTGVAHAFFWPPSQAIISEYSEGRERVKNIAKFTALFVGGFAAGPLVSSLMLAGGNDGGQAYREIFAVAAYVLAAAMISSVAVSRTKTGERMQKWSLDALRSIARFPEVVIMLLYCTTAFGVVLTIYPVFLHERGISDVEVGILFFAFSVSRIVALFTTGRLMKKTSLTLSAVTGSIAVAFIISFFGYGADAFLVAMLLMGFGFSVFFPLTLDIVLGKTRRDTDGSMIGVYETIFGAGWTVGPLAAGILSQYYGGAAPYAVFFVAGVGVTVMALLRRHRLEPAGHANP